MAQFFGSLKGTLVQKQKEHEPERVVAEGDGRTGMLTITASWEGAIRIKAYFNKKEGKDWVKISKMKWGRAGHKRGIVREIYHGPIGVEDSDSSYAIH